MCEEVVYDILPVYLQYLVYEFWILGDVIIYISMNGSACFSFKSAPMLDVTWHLHYC
jgi:hypothetical protein